jgi:hypothetical protein
MWSKSFNLLDEELMMFSLLPENRLAKNVPMMMPTTTLTAMMMGTN